MSAPVSAEVVCPAAALLSLLFPKLTQNLLSQRWSLSSWDIFVSPWLEIPHAGAPACPPLVEQAAARKGPKGRAGQAVVEMRDS